MEVTCPQCGRVLTLPTNRLSYRGRRVRCSGCGELIAVPGGPQEGPPQAAPQAPSAREVYRPPAAPSSQRAALPRAPGQGKEQGPAPASPGGPDATSAGRGSSGPAPGLRSPAAEEGAPSRGMRAPSAQRLVERALREEREASAYPSSLGPAVRRTRQLTLLALLVLGIVLLVALASQGWDVHKMLSLLPNRKAETLASGEIFYVVAEEAAVHSGPGETTRVVEVLSQGTRVSKLSSAEGWARVRTPSAALGYVAEGAIESREAKLARETAGMRKFVLLNEEIEGELKALVSRSPALNGASSVWNEPEQAFVVLLSLAAPQDPMTLTALCDAGKQAVQAAAPHYDAAIALVYGDEKAMGCIYVGSVGAAQPPEAELPQ